MILYLDNYRGFTNVFVPIKDLNILVGENSSGKTSLISILSFLTETDFLKTFHFKNRHVNLGNFYELVNHGRKDKTLTIGLIKDNNSETLDNRLDFDGVLMKFSSNKGYAALSELILINENSAIRLKKKGNNVEITLRKEKGFKMNIDHFGVFKSGRGFTERKYIKYRNVLDERWTKFAEKMGYLSLIHIAKEMNDDEDESFNDTFSDFEDSVIFMPSSSMLGSSKWIAPIRSKALGVYENDYLTYSPEGNHIPIILGALYGDKTKKQNLQVIEKIEHFGKQSGLFDKIDVNKLDKSNEWSPFELKIELFRQQTKISRVGYGVSQILPVICEILLSRQKQLFLIQQPEVHLHPRSQASFGELLFNEYIHNKHAFFIETHSDFLLDRLRIKYSQYCLTKTKTGQKKKKIDFINVLYFKNTETGVNVSPIKISKNGDYLNAEGTGFREFFMTEHLNLLGISFE